MNKHLILLLLLFSPFLLPSQTNSVTPATSEFWDCPTSDVLFSNPEQLAKQLQLEEIYLKKGSQAAEQYADSLPFVLPVVVHIVHQNGVENISDARVNAAIEHLNQAFANMGYYHQSSIGVHTQIQFCLARRDVNGLATSGITRTESPLTEFIMETQDLELKNLSRWNPKKYINIWIVKEINSIYSGPFVAGYALWPYLHGSEFDGVVCEAGYFGTDPARDAVVIHEMGHYLGLYHTFDGGCKNNDCTVDGDRVCDTPPDAAKHSNCLFNSCSTDVAPGSPFQTDVNDYTGDFMDYSPFSCYRYFTAGQAARMQTTVEMVRTSLLNSDGCMPGCTAPIVADFSVSPDIATAGQPVQFTSNSTGATHFSWSENGVEFSQDPNPTQVFSVAGYRQIVLTASNADEYCTETKGIQYWVSCLDQAAFNPAQTSAIVGSTIVFTNTSFNTSSMSYEWRIDSQLVSTSTHLSYLFNLPGPHLVELQATSATCITTASVWVLITGPCGQLQETVKANYKGTSESFVSRDQVADTDGSLIHCGGHGQRPMIVKWDYLGNVLWQKEMNSIGIFYQIEASPDGNFLLVGESGFKMMVAKINGNGEILWLKSMDFAGTTHFSGPNFNRMIAVNPDGSFGVFYGDHSENKYYLTKISSEGAVIWVRNILQVGYHASLQRATDGTGDFLMLSAGTFMTTSFSTSVFRISQTTGLTLKTYFIDFPFENLDQVSNLELAVHPDGGFSVFLLEKDFGDEHAISKYLVRLSASGAVMWAKRYTLPSNIFFSEAYFRPLPADIGWFILDIRQDQNNLQAGTYLQRLNNEGKIIWERKWSNPIFYEWPAVPVLQSGRVRGANSEILTTGVNWLNFPDDKIDYGCTPVSSSGTYIEPVNCFGYSTQGGGGWGPPPALTLKNISPEFTSQILTRSVSCAAILPCVEICDNQRDDDGDSLIDCFDDECSCFPLDTTECYADAHLPEFGIKSAWASGDSISMVFAALPLVANLDPQTDSISEIIVAGQYGSPYTSTIYIFKGDGTNKNAPKRLDIPGQLSTSGPSPYCVADLDKNGVPDIVALCKDKKIRIFSQYDPFANPPMQLWATSTEVTKYANGSIGVADFDSDGISEIYIGAQIFKLDLSQPNAPGLNLVLTGTAGNGYSSSGNGLVSSTVSDLLQPSECFGNPDCNGLELIAGTSVYSVDISTSDGDGLQITERVNLDQVDPSNAHYLDGYSAVADMDLDGIPEVVTNTRFSSSGVQNNGVAVWNRQGLKRFYPISTIEGPKASGGKVLIANVYDDTKAGFATDLPEIIVTGQYRLYCFNANKASKTPNVPTWWATGVEIESGKSGASAFDLNGDGMLEIICRDEAGLQILYGDAPPLPYGVDSRRRWASFPVASYPGEEYPVVADVNNDHKADIVATVYSRQQSGPLVSRVQVFESAARPWMPARALWNQYDYFNVNINNDLSVPAVPAKHWLEIPGPGSGKRPFNTHLVQGPASDSVLFSKLKVPDAALVLDEVACHADSFALKLRVCNSGSAPLPAGTPIAFYTSDPTVHDAALLFPPVAMDTTLDKGGCILLDWNIPATYDTTVFAVVNDAGNLPRPYQFIRDFPSTQQAECAYENNIVSFSMYNQTPLLDLGPDTSICQNSVLPLWANPGFQQYRWQDGSNSQLFTAFAAGTYWVEAVDACGFKRSDTVVVSINTLQTLDLPEERSVCVGDTVQLSASGFSTYLWSPADSLNCSDCAEVSLTAQMPFTVYLTASDRDCFVTDSVLIQVEPNPVLQWTAQPIPCAGGPGILTAIGLGGSGQFAYGWSNGATTASIEVLTPGYYAITISNLGGLGCSASDTALIETYGSIDLEATSIPVRCFGDSNGSATVMPLNGTAPYTWWWNTGQTNPSLNGLATGAYRVTVTDAIGCEGQQEIFIAEPPILSVLAMASDEILCPGEQTDIVAMVAGGTLPYAFLWNNGLTDSILLNMPAGNYTLMVNDVNGCSGFAFLQLANEPSILISLDSIQHASGPSTADGNLFVSVTGGKAPFSYWWSNGSTTQDLIGVPPGNYMLTVTDAGTCTMTVAATVDFVLDAGNPNHLEWTAFLLPNPTGQKANASLLLETPSAQEIFLQLLDATGRRLLEDRLDIRKERYRYMLQAPEAAGVYFVVLRNGAEVKCLKWVVTD